MWSRLSDLTARPGRRARVRASRPCPARYSQGDSAITTATRVQDTLDQMPGASATAAVALLSVCSPPQPTARLRLLAGTVAERPGVKAALAMARTDDPYAIAAPGPEHVRWG